MFKQNSKQVGLSLLVFLLCSGTVYAQADPACTWQQNWHSYQGNSQRCKTMSGGYMYCKTHTRTIVTGGQRMYFNANNGAYGQGSYEKRASGSPQWPNDCARQYANLYNGIYEDPKGIPCSDQQTWTSSGSGTFACISNPSVKCINQAGGGTIVTKNGATYSVCMNNPTSSVCAACFANPQQGLPSGGGGFGPHW